MEAAAVSGRKKAVVLGGGFAGVEAAIGLAGSGLFDVTLVSNRDFLNLFPITIWVPTRAIATERTQVPLADLARANGFTVLVDRVTRIDTTANQVHLDGDIVDYDHLVIALGAGKPQRPDSANALSLCTGPSETAQIQARIDELIVRGGGRIAVGFGANPKDPSAMRGGPAFEILFNLDHYLRRKGLRDRFELTFFAPMARPGQRMGEKALAQLDPQLGKRGIAQRTGSPITGFDTDGVRFENGTALSTDLTIFIPGGVGHPVVTASGLPTNEAGFAKIDAHCLVAGTTNVYAIGDVAELSGPDFRAKQGHVAEAMAHAAAHNIIAEAQSRGDRMGYADHVSILCLMDVGDGGVLVYRSTRREWAIPLPIVGHWAKRFWGFYARASKLRRFPRLPGL